MRKIIICFCIVIIMFSVAACKNGTIDNVVIEVGESNKFTKEDITKAIDCVKQNFSFPACTLTKLWYDEEKSNSFTQDYLEYGKGSVNSVQAENVIIILSNFDVDASGDNPV